MRKQIIGERILQVMTTPDRAAAIVGDLDERGVSSTQFWLAIGSNVLHSITPGVLKAAAKGCIAQFVFALAIATAMVFAYILLPVTLWPWFAALEILAAQIFTGYWITRRAEKQPLLICMLVVAADCILGLLRVNNASINMAIWSIPLLATTVAIDRRHRRKSVA